MAILCWILCFWVIGRCVRVWKWWISVVVRWCSDLSGLHVFLFWLVFEVCVECGAWPAHGYNRSHFQIELHSNIIVWSSGLHISSLCPLWIPSSRCLVSQNEHFVFLSVFVFKNFDFWRLFEGRHTCWLLSCCMSVNDRGTYWSLLCFFYDPNTLLLFWLFLSYHSVWGQPSFRLSHDQLDSAKPKAH